MLGGGDSHSHTRPHPHLSSELVHFEVTTPNNRPAGPASPAVSTALRSSAGVEESKGPDGDTDNDNDNDSGGDEVPSQHRVLAPTSSVVDDSVTVAPVSGATGVSFAEPEEAGDDSVASVGTFGAVGAVTTVGAVGAVGTVGSEPAAGGGGSGSGSHASLDALLTRADMLYEADSVVECDAVLVSALTLPVESPAARADVTWRMGRLKYKRGTMAQVTERD